MHKTLFTGAEGFFGTTLLRQKIPWIPTCQYEDEAKKLTQIFDKHVYEMDLTNYAQVANVIGSIRPDRIINLGAQSRPDLSWQIPVETVNANINGTLNLLVACHEHGLKPIIILASTSAQYGETFEENRTDSLNERAAQKPINPYGVTKAAAERLAFIYAQHYQLDIRYARIFNTSGYGKLGDVISDFSKRIVEANENSIIVGNLDSQRCFLHVDDTLLALNAIMEKGKAGEVYNICSGTEYNIKEIFKIICEVAGKDLIPKVSQKLVRPTDEPRIKGSIEKLKDLGWSEQKKIKDIIKDCIRFHSEQSI